MSAEPPSYNTAIPTLYDETHRGVWFPTAEIASMGNRGNLLGHLEHHAATTDGSFSICLANGRGAFVSQVCH